ncbi:hypothetical protein H4R35_001359 [Dimargaris xerosporica]|nr:hypothetical protein H4R35_001359 [Dimargaris xerosporica]
MSATSLKLSATAKKVVPTGDRLAALRAQMTAKDLNLHAYIVPSEDAHQSEYIAACDGRRAYISGFDGSAGCAVVGLETAAMFTDGRYFLQASQQMDSHWTLMKQGMPGIPTWQQYLCSEFPKGSRIGVDPKLIAAAEVSKLRDRLAVVESELVPIPHNLVDQVWTDRPAPPREQVFVLPTKYAGQAYDDKMAQIRQFLADKEAYGFIVSALDEIAWLFNLRGSDIPFNPVFFSYALVTQDRVVLYMDAAKLTTEAQSHLAAMVTLKPYAAVFEDVSQTSLTAQQAKMPLLAGQGASWALVQAAGESSIETVVSPVLNAKAIKNATELEGMRQAHIRDAAALVSYFAWLEDQLVFQGQDGKISETEGAEKLAQFRAQQDLNVGLSFDTISSIGANGAIIHYKPEHGSDAMINLREVYLCDSGGQYYDGTTDVTRTLHFGTPSAWERECFTRVLQGHIALDVAVFPKGTSGYLLDPLARRPLWAVGLDYRHGTGHGVGSFLNVHEGPHGIGTRASYNAVPLAAGMTVTNEPGYYEDGKFGIRIENVLLVKDADTQHNFGDKGYLGFENLTMVPMQRKMIVSSMLSEQERNWVNQYHQECLTKVGPLLQQKNPLAYQWLVRETAPL